MEVLALSKGVADRPRVNRDTLQQNLSPECDGDLHIVLAFAEKIRPNTYIDVLGVGLSGLCSLILLCSFHNFIPIIPL